MNSHLSSAIASIAASVDDALVAGRPTAALRAELRRLEQEQRTEAAKAAAAEREARAGQEAEEQASIQAKAAALTAEVQARVEAKLASMPPPPLAIRESPDGHIEVIEQEDC